MRSLMGLKAILLCLALLISFPSLAQEHNLTLLADTGYAGYGTKDDASLYLITANTVQHQILNNGDWRYRGDRIYDAPYNSFSINAEDDKSRIKIGGGSDTSTAHGARIIAHGNSHYLAPGQLILSAGNTSNIGSLGSVAGTASVIMETRNNAPIFLRTNDKTRFMLNEQGSITQDPTHGGDIVLGRDGTSIRQSATITQGSLGDCTELKSVHNLIDDSPRGACFQLSDFGIGAEITVSNSAKHHITLSTVTRLLIGNKVAIRIKPNKTVRCINFGPKWICNE